MIKSTKYHPNEPGVVHYECYHDWCPSNKQQYEGVENLALGIGFITGITLRITFFVLMVWFALWIIGHFTN